MKKIKEMINDFFADISIFFHSKSQMVKRMFFWGWKLRDSYDFDANTLYEIMFLKLDRVYTEMKDNSHCLWNSDINNPRMRDLREARELAKRLSNSSHYYEMKSFYETEEKFGKLKSWTEKIPNKPLYRAHSLWGGTEEIDKLARVYSNRRRKHWDGVLKAHKARFHSLLERRLNHWWD